MIEPAVNLEDNPTFLQFTDGGKVHVLGSTRALGQGIVPDEQLGTFNWIMQRQVALCGRSGEPGHLYGISIFYDNELCHRCTTLWPGDRVHLFEHGTPDD